MGAWSRGLGTSSSLSPGHMWPQEHHGLSCLAQKTEDGAVSRYFPLLMVRQRFLKKLKLMEKNVF